MANNSVPQSTGTVCVVHLVRRGNGLDAFLNFLQSYRIHPSGHDHTLLIIYKGFADDDHLADYRESLSGIEHIEMRVPDTGFDLGSYMRATRKHEFDYFFYLNSFSKILAPNWLKYIITALKQPGVGLAGASGSWASLNTFFNRNPPQFIERGLIGRVKHIFRRFRFGLQFDPFPNYHVRTNAFAIKRDIMIGANPGLMHSKHDAMRFESGRRSLTRYVMGRGLRPVIVDRYGCVYEKERWCDSNTFWNEKQQNLLVADNRTLEYDQATDDWRAHLSAYAWGTKARAYTCSE